MFLLLIFDNNYHTVLEVYGYYHLMKDAQTKALSFTNPTMIIPLSPLSSLLLDNKGDKGDKGEKGTEKVMIIYQGDLDILHVLPENSDLPYDLPCEHYVIYRDVLPIN